MGNLLTKFLTFFDINDVQDPPVEIKNEYHLYPKKKEIRYETIDDFIKGTKPFR